MTKAEQIAEILKKELGTNDIATSRSETDFGVSEYVTFWQNDELVKIRVSDHEATNKIRVEREIMFKDNESVEKMWGTIEQIIFPERFDFRPIEKGERPTHIKNGKMLVIIRK
jgi:hypothetical protein